MELTQKYLKIFLDYNPLTGDFIWKKEKRGVTVGKTAGSKSNGYVQIGITINNLRKVYAAHRLAWLYFYGYLPENQIDHIDNNKSNNSISNLRICSQRENNYNVSKKKDNTSGYKGVSYRNCNKKYRATIRVLGKNKHLGYFSTAKEASLKYQEKAKELHKEFYRD